MTSYSEHLGQTIVSGTIVQIVSTSDCTCNHAAIKFPHETRRIVLDKPFANTAKIAA